MIEDVVFSCLGQCENLEAEVKSLKEDGGGNFYQTMALPEGMHPSSSDIIADRKSVV